MLSAFCRLHAVYRHRAMYQYFIFRTTGLQGDRGLAVERKLKILYL